MAMKGMLALENGLVFEGESVGARKTVVGEAVFNTSMVGYQEILTDPSYFAQIVTMTAPQIGNYGINPEDSESDGPKVAGFIMRELSPISSNWRSEQPLDAYLKNHGIPALQGVDTRALTKTLRLQGALKACLSTEGFSKVEALRRAREWPGLIGVDFVQKVTCSAPFKWEAQAGQKKTSFSVKGTRLRPEVLKRQRRFKLAVFDFGIKRSILRKLSYYGFDSYLLPAHTSAQEVHALAPDALFLSNGPGDPAALPYAHKTLAQLLGHYPIFGICLGHQILTHALGAETVKLKFGHRGANQPIKNLETGEVRITAQNHGFAASREALEKCDALVTEINLNDGTVEAMRHKTLPVFSVQYHPEAAPGPNDADRLFDRFYQLVEKHVGSHKE